MVATALESAWSVGIAAKTRRNARYTSPGAPGACVGEKRPPSSAADTAAAASVAPSAPHVATALMIRALPSARDQPLASARRRSAKRCARPCARRSSAPSQPAAAVVRSDRDRSHDTVHARSTARDARSVSTAPARPAAPSGTSTSGPSFHASNSATAGHRDHRADRRGQTLDRAADQRRDRRGEARRDGVRGGQRRHGPALERGEVELEQIEAHGPPEAIGRARAHEAERRRAEERRRRDEIPLLAEPQHAERQREPLHEHHRGDDPHAARTAAQQLARDGAESLGRGGRHAGGVPDIPGCVTGNLARLAARS